MQAEKRNYNKLISHLIIIGIVVFLLAHTGIAETHVDYPAIESGTGNVALSWQQGAFIPVAAGSTTASGSAALPGDPGPSFSLSSSAEPISIDTPGMVNFTVTIKNTGNVSLSGFKISAAVPDTFSVPTGDSGIPGVLDVNETWMFTGQYMVTQEVIDGNGVDADNTIDNDGDIDSTVKVRFAEHPQLKKTTTAITVVRRPAFSVTKTADVASVKEPGIITYTIEVKNTGNVSLTEMTMSDPVLDSLKDTPENRPETENPKGDINNPDILDVGEVWTYTYRCKISQDIVDRNGIDGGNIPPSGVDNNSGLPPGNGEINNTVTVDFAETDPQETGTTVKLIQSPQFTVTKKADTTSVNEPEIVNYTINIKNTGNLSLTQVSISAPLLEDLDGPEGDEKNPGILDVNETWSYSGSYAVTQEVIDANGVDANNIIDGDGDIDSTVMVSVAEIDIPQTAYAPVETELFITGDIFEKKYRYLHGFLAGTQSFTTNLYKTDRDPESSWTTNITPGIWATFPSQMKRSVEIVTQNASPGGLAIEPFNPSHFQRFQAYILYSPQLEIYHDQKSRAYQAPDLGAGIIDDDNIDRADDELREFTGQGSVNRLTHRVDAMLHYHSGNKLSVRAIDQYKISYDAFSERAYFTDDKYTSNVFNLAGTFDPTEKLQLRLDYSKFCLDYEDSFNQDADRVDDIYAAYLFFRLTAKSSVFLEYDFADIDYDTSSKDSHEHRYFAGLRWEMSGKSSGQIKGGFGKKKTTDSPMLDTDVEVSDVSQNNWMAAIQIDHNLTAKTNLTLNAYRRYDEVLEHRYDFGIFDRFYADYSLAHFAGLKFSWNIISNIHLNLDTSLFYDEFINSRQFDREGIQKDREDWEFAVSPSIAIDLFDHFSVSAAYIYTDHDSNYPEHDYFDNTVFVRASLFL